MDKQQNQENIPIKKVVKGIRNGKNRNNGIFSLRDDFEEKNILNNLNNLTIEKDFDQKNDNEESRSLKKNFPKLRALSTIHEMQKLVEEETYSYEKDALIEYFRSITDGIDKNVVGKLLSGSYDKKTHKETIDSLWINLENEFKFNTPDREKIFAQNKEVLLNYLDELIKDEANEALNKYSEKRPDTQEYKDFLEGSRRSVEHIVVNEETLLGYYQAIRNFFNNQYWDYTDEYSDDKPIL